MVFSLQKMQIIFIALFSCSCTEISLSDKKLHLTAAVNGHNLQQQCITKIFMTFHKLPFLIP